MKIIFMGTPEFAVPCLKKLINSRNEIVGIVCQPDKPKGRGRKITSSPVKSLAKEIAIPLLQPEKIKTDEFYRQISDINPDLICVTAYGKILPLDILKLPRYGCINVHASLLPKYRGAAPINWAIINGEKKTGVTIMLMDEGMDTGDILAKTKVEIKEEETSIELSQKLAEYGATLLMETIDRLEQNELTPIRQNDADATYAPIIKKDVGKINWEKKAEEINNLIRGTQPWPGSFTNLNNKTLKIFKASVSNDSGKPGEILRSNPGTLRIGTGEKSLNLLEIQIEGGKKIKTEDFLRGHRVKSRWKLGI